MAKGAAIVGVGLLLAGGFALMSGGGKKKKNGNGGGGGGGGGGTVLTPPVEPPKPPVSHPTCAAMQAQWKGFLSGFGIPLNAVGPTDLLAHPELAALQAAMQAVGCPIPTVGATGGGGGGSGTGPIHTELKDCAFWQAEFASATAAMNAAVAVNDGPGIGAASLRQGTALNAMVALTTSGVTCAPV